MKKIRTIILLMMVALLPTAALASDLPDASFCLFYFTKNSQSRQAILNVLHFLRKNMAKFPAPVRLIVSEFYPFGFFLRRGLIYPFL